MNIQEINNFRRRAGPPPTTDDSAAEELLRLAAEGKTENIEQITGLLDTIWRKPMITGKDYEALDAGKKFLREFGSQQR